MLLSNIQLFGYANSQNQSHSVVISETGTLEVLSKDQVLQHQHLIPFDCHHEYAIMPGWFDTHVHGYGGVDFSDATVDNIATITKALGKTGLSYCMATLVSLKLDKLKSALRAINDYVAKHQTQIAGVTQIVGIHLEGPFIAKNCKGAHAADALLDHIDMPMFLDIISAAPLITEWKMTLAPELPGAIDFIRQSRTLPDISVNIFLGHNNASEEIISAAISAGAVGFTHLGNACCEKNNRAQETFTLQKATSHLTRWVFNHADICPNGVELITDGKHLSASYVQALTAKIADKIVLITDALGPSDLADGPYRLGELPIIKHDDAFYLAEPNNPTHFLLEHGNKKLAGSAAAFSKVTAQFVKWLTTDLNDTFSLLYHASVKNPRETSLSKSAGERLPDHNNFVVVNKKGELVVSVCHGEVRRHQMDDNVISVISAKAH